MTHPFTIEIDVRFRDTDLIGHVNNAVFLTYLESARARWYQTLEEVKVSNFNFIVARIEIDYLAPIYLHEPLEVKMWVSHIGNKSWRFSYIITNRTTQEVKAKALSVQVSYDYKNNHSTVIGDRLRGELENMYVPAPDDGGAASQPSLS